MGPGRTWKSKEPGPEGPGSSSQQCCSLLAEGDDPHDRLVQLEGDLTLILGISEVVDLAVGAGEPVSATTLIHRHADDRSAENRRACGAEEAGVTEGEDSSIRGH